MADPEEPKGELNIEELARESGVTIAYGPIQNMIPYLKTLSDAIREALSNPEIDKIPFQVPQISMPHDVNYVSVLTMLLILMYTDPWLRDNAIIVCFGTQSGVSFGVARSRDKEYWEGDQGKHNLQTEYISIRTIEEYKDMAAAQLR